MQVSERRRWIRRPDYEWRAVLCDGTELDGEVRLMSDVLVEG